MQVPLASLEAFRNLCEAKGLSVTHQRWVIYQALMQVQGHPSPEAVYEIVRSQIPSVSLGTVYKNIRTFVDAGLVREVSLHHGPARLETNMTPHHHLVCSRCKTIFDLAESDLEPLGLRSSAPDGFQVHRFSVEVIGLCSNCAQA